MAAGSVAAGQLWDNFTKNTSLRRMKLALLHVGTFITMEPPPFEQQD